MEASLEALEVIRAMAEQGLPSSASDAGVGALMAAAAVRGAHLNVRINAATLAAPEARRGYLDRAAGMEEQARAAETAVLKRVEQRMESG